MCEKTKTGSFRRTKAYRYNILLNFFKQYVKYDFTAALEDQLDHISAGDADYKDVLSKFWRDFSGLFQKPLICAFQKSLTNG